MASQNIHDGTPTRFEAGGIIYIDDGTTKYFFKNTEPGTLQRKDGFYENLPYTHVGSQKQALLGDAQLSSIKINVKAAKSGTVANSLTALAAQTAGTPDGLVKEWTLVIWEPYFLGASTGDLYTWANTRFAEQPDKKASDKFDILDCAWLSRAINPAVTNGASAPT